MSRTPFSTLPRDLRMAYVAVVLVAFWLRARGIGFGADTPWARPDEEIFAQHAIELFETTHPGMAGAGWPDLFFWVHHLVLRALRLVWELQHGGRVDPGCVLTLHPSAILVPVRWVSVLAGTATVGALMRLGYLLVPDTYDPSARHRAALASGVFYAVNVLVARDAHFAVSDTVLLLFQVLGLTVMSRASFTPTRGTAFATGLFYGLACSTKWTALPFLIPVGVVFLGQFARLRGHVAGLVGLGLAGIALGFLIGTPHAATDAMSYLDGLRSHAVRFDPNAANVFTYVAGSIPGGGLVDHGTRSLPYGFGWPLLVVAILGMAWALVASVQHRREALFGIVAFVGIFYVFVLGRSMLTFTRYSLPLHPPLAIFAALVVERATRRFPRGAFVGATVVLALLPAQLAFRTAEMMARPGTRELARAWLLAHADGPTEGSFNYSQLHLVEPQLAQACEALMPRHLRRRQPSLDTASQAHLVRRADWDSYQLTGTTITSRIFGGAPGFEHGTLVSAQPFVPCGEVAPYYRAPIPPSSCFEEVASFRPEGVACDAMFDPMDHYFAPLDGFGMSTVMGPEIRIFRRTCPPAHR